MSNPTKQHEGFVDAVKLTVSLCLTYTICVACLRSWIRRSAIGADDIVIAFTTLVTVGHTGCNYAAIADGLGKPWTAPEKENRIHQLSSASIAGIVTFLVAVYASKAAVLTFLARITKNKMQIRIYYISIATVCVFGFTSILIATVACPASSGYYWAFHANKSSCPSEAVRWQVITALDVISEVLLLVLPVQLVWGLQMPWMKKATILAAFYLRIPVIGFSIARNYYTLQLRLPHRDAGLDSALVTIWLEIQLAYALAASTLSALKAFTESFNSGFGLGFARDGGNSYGMSKVSGISGPSSQLEKVTATDTTSSRSQTRPSHPHGVKDANINVSVKALNSASNSSEQPALRLRPEAGLKNFTRVSAEPTTGEAPWHHEHSCGNSDSSGDEMVILRETEYSVQHDRAPMLY